MKIIWSRAAHQDRRDIFDHIAESNAAAAASMDLLFSGCAARLAQFPHLGQVGIIPGTREIIVHESFRMVYKVAAGPEGQEEILILTLVHTSRQWPPVRQ